MAILRNVELWWARLNPKFPNSTFNKENPTWDIQIRTSDLQQKAEWQEAGLTPKLLSHPTGSPQEGEPMLNSEGKRIWRVDLRKRTKNKEGENLKPVLVVDGQLQSLEPDLIGNGSTGNVRISQYKYDKGGKEMIGNTLMEVQITRLIKSIRKPREGFEITDMEVVEPAPINLVESEEEDAPF